MAYQSTTYSAIRQQIGMELGLCFLIPNGDFTSVQAGGITSTRRLANNQWGPGYWAGQDAGIYRPGAASSADYWRYADQLTSATGALTITGTYSDQTVGSEVAEIWKKAGTVYRPDIEVLNAINYCLQFEMIDTFSTISHLGDNDPDMTASATSAYTSSSASLTKVTTASKILYGPRALRVANSGVAGFARSAGITVTKSQAVSAFALAAVTTGTATLKIDDTINAVTIASLATTELEPQLLQIPWTNVNSNTTTVALSMVGSGASDDHAWNMLWLYKLNETWFDLPSYISEQFKVMKVYRVRPRMASTTAYVYYGRSLITEPLEEGKDYHFAFAHADANPYRINFTDVQAFDWPIMIQCKRPASDFGTFSGADETQTTVAPLHTLIPRVKLHLLDHVLIPGYPDDKRWIALRSIAAKELKEAMEVRAEEPVTSDMPVFARIGRF